MSDGLISRKEAIDILENMIFEVGKDLSKSYLLQDERERIIGFSTAFDKEKVIEELKCECDNRLKNWEENLFWNENRKEEGVIKGLSMAITIVEKGGIE